MRRRVVYIAGALAVLPLLLLVIALLIPAERVGGFVAARASAALDRDVTVERFRVRVLPRPAISLEGVVVGGPREAQPAGEAVSAFASAGRVELRPRILPLFRRDVIVEDIRVDRLRVLVDVDDDGVSNVPAFESDPDGEPGGDAELRIRRLRISDGRIGYRDARDGTVLRLDGIEQTLRLRGSVTAGELSRAALVGSLDIRDIDADLPGRLAWPLRDVRIGIAHELQLDRGADRLDITSLQLTLQDIPLHLSGSVAALGDADAREVDLRAGTGSFDVARLIASLPRALLEGASGDVIEGAAGRAGLDVVVRGRAGNGSVPHVSGSLALEDAALDRGRHGRIADGLGGVITFTLDSVGTDGISGRLLGEPFHATAAVSGFAAPHGSVALRTALAMAQATKLGLLPDDATASGRIGIDLRATGPFTRPGDVALHGHVDLAGITLQPAALQQAVVVAEGRIRFDGTRASAQQLRTHIGTSDVQLDFTADQWLPFALGDTTQVPVVTFEATSRRFDADEIFGIERERYTYGELFFARLADRPVDGRTAAEAAEEIGLGLPDVPDISMDGRVRAAQLINGGVAFDDVDVSVAARGGVLDVQAASFRMMGGGVHLTGRLGLAAGGARAAGGAGTAGAASPAAGAQPQLLVLDYTVSGVGAQQFLERFTTFREHIGGELLLQGSVRMGLDEHLLPVTESVAGAGTIAVLDGELVNWPLLRVLGERLGVARFDTLAFHDWTGRYTFAGNRVILDESMLQGRELSVRAAGSFDFAGNLDIGATLYVPQQWAQRIPGAPAAFLVNLVAATDGRVPVGARISGSASAPQVRLDLSEAGARTAAAAREAAQQEAREAASRVLEQVTDALPPRDSVAARADSLRRNVQDNIADRLRRVIRPPGGGG